MKSATPTRILAFQPPLAKLKPAKAAIGRADGRRIMLRLIDHIQVLVDEPDALELVERYAASLRYVGPPRPGPRPRTK